MGILPWLIGGALVLYAYALVLYAYNKNRTDAEGMAALAGRALDAYSTTEIRGLDIPSGYVLSSANALALRGILSGSGAGLTPQALTVIRLAVGPLSSLNAATRLTIAQRILDDLVHEAPGRSVSDAIISLG